METFLHLQSAILAAPAPGNLESEATILFAESNHRIANNLTMTSALLRLRARDVRKSSASLTPDEAAAMLDEASARIEVAGNLHRVLAQTGADVVMLDEYLGVIAACVIDSLSEAGSVHLTTACEAHVTLPAHDAFTIGLVIAELITNAIKYAHPALRTNGRIELGCASADDGRLQVWVADDGVGLPEGFDPARDGGLGMRTARMLVDKMGATLAFESDGLGLTASLLVPATA